ncbi:hypothetical protein AVEN_196602-1 [Araneus ventricosus]|uniref:Integrase catalytic domain-containing protein n=1 Tax=Araneus ventricosus TaxID=182803 RepID=A0A4Y2GQ29_ARAVE|nr:hypothetical protein AVEN_196602-1 [Araneus ventricosus]
MNGVAERLNRTMAEGVRCLRLEAELPKDLWAELAYTFIYLKNRFPHKRGKAGPRLRSHNYVKKYCEDNNIKYDAQQFNFHHQVGEPILQSHTDDDDSSGLENYHTTI